MAIVYFDSSALVKLVVVEPGSSEVDDLWDGADAAFASRLAYPEVCAALTAAHRNHVLSAAQRDRSLASWETYWQSIRAVELTEELERSAGDLARTHPLSGADAVHLASALALSTPDVVVATWDRRLAVAAAREQLAIAPRAPDR